MSRRGELARRLACAVLQAALLLPLALGLLPRAERLCACGMVASRCSCSLTGRRCGQEGGGFRCILRAPVSPAGTGAPAGTGFDDRLCLPPGPVRMAEPGLEGRLLTAAVPAGSSLSRPPEPPPPKSASASSVA